MLSEDLRNAMRHARGEVAHQTMTADLWLVFCERIEEIADEMEQWERSATPRQATRLVGRSPEHVVVLSDWLEARRGGAPDDAA